MVKRKADIVGNVQTNFKGGEGDVTMYNFLTEQEAKGAGRLFARSVLEPGCSIGSHQHDGDGEAYYILTGTALISDNGTDVTLGAGDCQICADGQSHSIKNVGKDTLEYIAIILYTKQKDM